MADKENTMLSIFDRPVKAYLCLDCESRLPQNLSLLPDAVRHRVEHYTHPEARRKSLLAYLLLRRALEEQGKEGQLSRLSVSPSGKPAIPQFPFSLSHCRGASVCCVCQEDIGADIEIVRAFNAKLVSSVLDPRSLDCYSLLDGQEKDIYFARQWTLRESYLKLTGEGVRLKLNRLAPEARGNGYLLRDAYIVSERIGTEIWLSAATYQERPALEVFRVGAEQLLFED